MAQIPFLGVETSANDTPFLGSQADTLNLDGVELKIRKGIANGYAPLDGNAKVPVANLPDTASLDAEVDGKITTHNSATTSVHGISNTADLATKTYADGANSTHNSATTSVHGIADTANLVLTNDLRLSDPKAGVQWTDRHTNSTGNPYLVGSIVYNAGRVYRCIAENDSIPPQQGGNPYWADLGVGYLLPNENPKIEGGSIDTSTFIPPDETAGVIYNNINLVLSGSFNLKPTYSYNEYLLRYAGEFVPFVEEITGSWFVELEGQIIATAVAGDEPYPWLATWPSGTSITKEPNRAGGSINASGGAGGGGGSINTSNDGGSINTSNDGGSINTSNNGGSILLNGFIGEENQSSGGSIDLRALTDEGGGGQIIATGTNGNNGGSINISAGVNGNGGSINLSNGGGSITMINEGGSINTSGGGGSINISDVGGSINLSVYGGSINLSGNTENDTNGGSISATASLNYNGGSLNMSAGWTGAGGSINTSNDGGSISTMGGDSGSGGSINTSAGNSDGGGSIDTSGGEQVGGSINTSNGGGSINTRGVGSIELGETGTRTTLNGSASGGNKTITLPNATGTIALTSDVDRRPISYPVFDKTLFSGVRAEKRVYNRLYNAGGDGMPEEDTFWYVTTTITQLPLVSDKYYDSEVTFSNDGGGWSYGKAPSVAFGASSTNGLIFEGDDEGAKILKLGNLVIPPIASPYAPTNATFNESFSTILPKVGGCCGWDGSAFALDWDNNSPSKNIFNSRVSSNVSDVIFGWMEESNNNPFEGSASQHRSFAQYEEDMASTNILLRCSKRYTSWTDGASPSVEGNGNTIVEIIFYGIPKSLSFGTTTETYCQGNDSRIANIKSSSINTKDAMSIGHGFGTGGTIDTSGKAKNSNVGSPTPSGGNINTSGGYTNEDGWTGGAGGSINTGGENGVYLASQAGSRHGRNGGSIDTSAGGGAISTRGVGSIQLGETGTRTTLVGSASATDKTITLPNASGTIALTSDVRFGSQTIFTLSGEAKTTFVLGTSYLYGCMPTRGPQLSGSYTSAVLRILGNFTVTGISIHQYLPSASTVTLTYQLVRLTSASAVEALGSSVVVAGNNNLTTATSSISASLNSGDQIGLMLTLGASGTVPVATAATTILANIYCVPR